MTQSIISAGPQLAAGRSLTTAIPTFTPNFPTLTFNSNSHGLAFTSHTDNFTLRRRSRRPITPIRASAAAAESSSMYVTTDNFYDLLEIPATVTAPEIKQAYRKLARKYHPDVSPPEKAEEYTKQFLRVQEAYETLSDPRSKAQYDMDLASGFHLGFSAKNQFNKGMDPRGEWKQRWEIQIEELQSLRQRKKQSNWQSWGDRMRASRGSCEFSFN
ncbi:Chaperone protein dnaJ 20, chloroplastic [Linum perenne]